ncbi:unnamed protein product [Diatraea saccharalis]|uniref:MADF domain-containing protein n=1 Tax=Diatraea saccharalis TaxID=40085 RepID=A0A9N9WDF6_9NEOP|nr:unnamed protein product [Diatraea saccharalis]
MADLEVWGWLPCLLDREFEFIMADLEVWGWIPCLLDREFEFIIADLEVWGWIHCLLDREFDFIGFDLAGITMSLTEDEATKVIEDDIRDPAEATMSATANTATDYIEQELLRDIFGLSPVEPYEDSGSEYVPEQGSRSSSRSLRDILGDSSGSEGNDEGHSSVSTSKDTRKRIRKENLWKKNVRKNKRARVTDSCKRCDNFKVKIDACDTNEISKKNELTIAKELHLRKAESAMTNLKLDMQNAKQDNDTTVIIFDLMKTLPAPVISTGICYYKRQLWTYCLGIHNAGTDEMFMYVWDESTASRGPQEIVENIDHKFTVSGHSFSSCDRAFGLVEKQKKYFPNIYVPEHWNNVILAARKKKPFQIVEMKRDAFISTKALETNITNRKIGVDGTCVDVRIDRLVVARAPSNKNMSVYTWSNENVYKLIEMFQAGELLWNTISEDYKDRNKKHDAWMEIASEFNVDKKVIEKKIRSLVGQFNRESKSKSGAGGDESIKWFAYKKLMFLKGKNIPSSTVDGGLQVSFILTSFNSI